MRDRNQPQYGYGHFDRPLWTARDRNAEAIREVLRRAGRREFTLGLAPETAERHGGFVAEDGETHATLLVACAGLHDDEAAAEVRHYAEALTAAGYQVTPDLDADLVLQVRR
jgi:hypothetical protein